MLAFFCWPILDIMSVMNKGFWNNLPRPFFALAPMYDVTDSAFRFIIAKYGKPDVFYTEFTSTDGLCSVGRDKLMQHLRFAEIEHPIVAQVFGTKPENFYNTAKLIADLGFDGLDINMGCPDKNIIKTGSCAALFKTPKLAQELIQASQAGATRSDGTTIPISVKIRIGDTKIDWQNWIGSLLQANPAAIAIHLRTRKEMSKIAAHWELMPEIVKFIHQQTTAENRPIIIGNGDVESLEQAKLLAQQTGSDGIMLGRAIFGNPWLFSNRDHPASLEEKLHTLIEHIKLYNEHFDGIKHFDVMKRHFKAYVHGFDGSNQLRAELYECSNATNAINAIKNYLDQN